MPTRTAFLVVVLTACTAMPARGQAPADNGALLDDAYRQYYSGKNEAAVGLALPHCTTPPVNLAACELATTALHFQIKRLLGPETQKKKWEQCAECPGLMETFLAVTARGQAAAKATIAADPTDDDTKFFLGKLDLNFVWLQLGTLGKKTGWKEYWEARKLLDDLVKRKPEMVRARVARAWIDYIVATKMPRGARWVLGGGDKKKGLNVVREAAEMPAAFFDATEAAFALWDMQVREKQMPAAVVTARKLARDFPENEELARFLATNDPEARR